MKANELRIGNWCASPYEPKIFKVSAMHILHLEEGMDSLSILGIPLTPEILEKAGFVKSINFDNTYIKLIKGESFILKDCKDGTFFVYTGIRCQYLHQLQNLYFALTGEELNIEL
jgi:hypothetical protein